MHVCNQLLKFNTPSSVPRNSLFRFTPVPSARAYISHDSGIIINRQRRLLKKQMFSNVEYSAGAGLVQQFVWLNFGFGSSGF